MKTQSTLVQHNWERSLVCIYLFQRKLDLNTVLDCKDSNFFIFIQSPFQILSRCLLGLKTLLISFTSIERLSRVNMFPHTCMNGLISYLGEFYCIFEGKYPVSSLWFFHCVIPYFIACWRWCRSSYHFHASILDRFLLQR